MTVRVTNRPDPEQWPDDLACALATVADPHPEGVGMFLGQTLSDPVTDSCPEHVPGTERGEQWVDSLGNVKHVHHWQGERCYLKQNHGGPHVRRTDAPFVWVRKPGGTRVAEEWYSPSPTYGPRHRQQKPGTVGYIATFPNSSDGNAALAELKRSLAPGVGLKVIAGGPQGSNPNSRSSGNGTRVAEAEYWKVYLLVGDAATMGKSGRHVDVWAAEQGRVTDRLAAAWESHDRTLRMYRAELDRRQDEQGRRLLAETENAKLRAELATARRKQTKAPPRPSTNPLAWIPEHLRAKAYAALAKIVHPDTGGDNATMQTLNKAYHGRPNR